MYIEQKLYQAAKELLEKRYPTGWGGAAAMYTNEGEILTSVAPEVINASTELCIETGAILEAHKFNTKITHSICIVRDDENEEFKVLTPCGVCQERLMYWGRNVKVAVTSNDEKPLFFKSLEEVQPYHWSKAYKDEELFD
ncbi:cytidine deaminase [Halobacillus karajensis]|uniref:Cytidine deaminase n=1 Tax=Halobacillus karajensis TaxID=195088 RepID=A0A024P7Q2_9BACI|nr:cytidine deaminase [Halobacillus karajensis]CDQ20337.1 cytidine deaminase [Halobacillus karajensis]CDQ23595.1 cytidine deaminase [Halobacillus karajensis]CDQ25149.1 cytidine deaminase [Halobacillus karajensis]CDQ28490.1 cytidine deaminase [Halobacillus karajensis]CDQ29802.1 cytidine deaminase [Halobacillus karajensis]